MLREQPDAFSFLRSKLYTLSRSRTSVNVQLYIIQ